MTGSDKPSAPSQPDNPPSVPGHELLRRIAHGSYGEIWLARTELATFRAVKIIRRASFSDARPYDREFAGIQRYEPVSREHEGLVDVLQVGQDEAAGFFYYVMELADDAAVERSDGVMENWSDVAKSGPQHSTTPLLHLPPTPPLHHPDTYVPLTLSHVIRQRHHLPVSEVIELGIGLARAMEFLHSRRLAHRDIKPSNIIFAGGQPKLADVGLVADLGNPQSLVGTLGYFPPEGPGTAQADIYSLGKVLYEAATGKDRQDFPDLPTRLGEGHDDPALPELNEVLLKACEGQSRARYRSAGEMAADLERLKAGQSLRARRVRRRRVRAIATATVATAGVVLGLIGLVVLAQYERSRPRLLFRDDFDGIQLDTNLWTCGHLESFEVSGKGRPWHQVEPSGGELVLQAKADHEDGYTIQECVWVDLKRDLLMRKPCRLEIEMSGALCESRFILAICGEPAPPANGDVGGIELLRLEALNHETNAWPTLRMRIDLLTNRRVAVMYPDAKQLDAFEVVDLRNLPVWRLRFFANARTSRGITPASTDLRIKEVRGFAIPESDFAVGQVLEMPSEWALADAVIKDSHGRVLAKTRENGHFAVPLGRGVEPLTIQGTGYVSVDAQPLAGPLARQFTTVHLRKEKPGPGDVIEAISYGDFAVSCIGFRGDTLTLLADESFRAVRLLPFDLAAGRVALDGPGARTLALATTNLISGFVVCGNRLVGIKHWQGAIWDLDVEPPELLLELKHARDGSSISYPAGATFDGQYLWFVEMDATNQRFGIHALDLDRKIIVHSLTSTDKAICGIAWDGKRFWISNQKGQVYEIDREAALGIGTLDMGILRRFRGNFTWLTYARGCLWGLDPDRHHICKIKITD